MRCHKGSKTEKFDRKSFHRCVCWYVSAVIVGLQGHFSPEEALADYLEQMEYDGQRASPNTWAEPFAYSFFF
jgi:hypothetical protein